MPSKTVNQFLENKPQLRDVFETAYEDTYAEIESMRYRKPYPAVKPSFPNQEQPRLNPTALQDNLIRLLADFSNNQKIAIIRCCQTLNSNGAKERLALFFYHNTNSTDFRFSRFYNFDFGTKVENLSEVEKFFNPPKFTAKDFESSMLIPYLKGRLLDLFPKVIIIERYNNHTWLDDFYSSLLRNGYKALNFDAYKIFIHDSSGDSTDA